MKSISLSLTHISSSCLAQLRIVIEPAPNTGTKQQAFIKQLTTPNLNYIGSQNNKTVINIHFFFIF